MSTDDASLSLVVPFVVVTSKGGPHDDLAFTAGYQCGQIDAVLAQDPENAGFPVFTSVVPQVDLIAMRHGFRLIATPWDEAPDEWTWCEFERSVVPA